MDDSESGSETDSEPQPENSANCVEKQQPDSEPQPENNANSVEKQPKYKPRSTTRLPFLASENIPKKKQILLNEDGLPKVRGQANLKSYMGVIARAQIPIDIDSWKYVPLPKKDRLWQLIQSRFEVESVLRKRLLSECGDLWRNFKSRLTGKILKYKDQPQKLKKPPTQYPQIKQQQWDRFVKSRLSEAFQDIHEKQSEKRSKNIYNHRSGRNGYDGLKEILIERGDYTLDEIDRGVLWKEARKVDGEYKDEACKQKGDEIDEFEKRRKDGTVDEDSDIDAITKLFGPEHPGRVRAAGKHITPTSFFGKSRSRFSVTKAQHKAVLEENKRLKLANASLEKEVLAFRQSHQSSAASRPHLAQPTMSESSRSPKIRKKSVTATTRSSEVEKAYRPHLAQPTMSESSRSPIIKKKSLTATTRSSEVEKTIANSLLKQIVPKRKRSGSDIYIKSKQKKVSESPTDTFAQRSGIGKGKPCKLLFIDSDEVAAGNVFDSTSKQKVHNVELGEDNFHVQVLSAKDLEALVPIPVEDEIVTVRDALGTYVAWPKELVIVEEKGEDTASPSDFLEKFLQDATCHLKKLGGAVLATIDANVFKTATNDSVYITEGDIESICKQELRASVTDVVIYIRYLHQKVLSARKQNKFTFMDPTVITASASSSSKLTRDLVARMDKTTAELVFVPYVKNHHWVLMVVNLSIQKVWWLDSQVGQQDKEIDKIMQRVVEGCLKKRQSNGSTVFCFPQHIPQHKNNWESGFYAMRFMKEIIEGQLKLNSTVMRKSEYNEGEIMEVRREWVNHVLPLLVT